MHKKLAEAALFISANPLGLDELAKIMGVNSLGFVKQVMGELQKKYENSGIEIIDTPNGWTMQVRQEFLPKVAHLTPYHDLSEGTKKTLALVVYKEPVRQSEIIKTQGNKAYVYIKDLVKKGLVRTEKDGRTKLLYLTPEFERYFGEERRKIREKMDMLIQKTSQETGNVKQETKDIEIERTEETHEQTVEDNSKEIKQIVSEPKEINFEELKKKIKK